jgi:hypothetical protein
VNQELPSGEHHYYFRQKFSGIWQKIDQFSGVLLKMGHFLDFSVTPKSGLFWKCSFPKIPEKKVK